MTNASISIAARAARSPRSAAPVIVTAALGLGVGLDQIECLGLGKPGYCRALRLQAKSGAPLPRRRDSDIAIAYRITTTCKPSPDV